MWIQFDKVFNYPSPSPVSSGGCQIITDQYYYVVMWRYAKSSRVPIVVSLSIEFIAKRRLSFSRNRLQSRLLLLCFDQGHHYTSPWCYDLFNVAMWEATGCFSTESHTEAYGELNLFRFHGRNQIISFDAPRPPSCFNHCSASVLNSPRRIVHICLCVCD